MKLVKNQPNLNNLVFILSLFLSSFTLSQNNLKYSLGVSYGNTFIKPDTTYTSRSKLWQDPNQVDEYAEFRANITHTPSVFLNVEHRSGFGLSLVYTVAVRRYYFWPGTYSSEDYKFGEKNTLDIAPYVQVFGIRSKSFGQTLFTERIGLSPSYKVKLGKLKKAGFHIALGLEVDNYEKLNLKAFDSSIGIRYKSAFSDTINASTEYYAGVNGDNPEVSPWVFSANARLSFEYQITPKIQLLISGSFKSTPLNSANIDINNHYELSGFHTRTKEGEDVPFYSTSYTDRFPIYISGLDFSVGLKFLMKDFKF